MDEAILTTGETARLLDLSPNTVRWYAEIGLLKARRTSRGTRIFLRSDVEALAAKRAAKERQSGAKRRAH